MAALATISCSVPDFTSQFTRVPPQTCNPRLGSVTGRQGFSRFRRAAKFQPFEQELHDNGSILTALDVHDERDDSVLPNDLEEAIKQSSQSTADFISAGGMRAIVELLLPDVENLNEEGAQQRLWDLGRLYVETLQAKLGKQGMKVIFPDAGAAALLKHRWNDTSFCFGSLNDRKPVNQDDEIVVLLAPDYQMLNEVQRIASSLLGDEETMPTPLVMWNPHLFSGDVGIGLNVRRTRENFLSTFTTVYSMRPLSTGAVFKRYPGLWQIFLDDADCPGRYVLIREQPQRPVLDDLDLLLLTGDANGGDKEPSQFMKVLGFFSSLNRFMRSLSQ